MLKINPDRHDAVAKLVHFTHYVCDWSRRKTDVPRPLFYNRISVSSRTSGWRAALPHTLSNLPRPSNICGPIQRHYPALHPGRNSGCRASALRKSVQGCEACSAAARPAARACQCPSARRLPLRRLAPHPSRWQGPRGYSAEAHAQVFTRVSVFIVCVGEPCVQGAKLRVRHQPAQGERQQSREGKRVTCDV